MENQNKSNLILAVMAVVVLAFSWDAVDTLRSGFKVPSSGTMAQPRSARMSAPPTEDSVAAIDTELQEMSVEGLDSELSDIDKELNQ